MLEKLIKKIVGSRNQRIVKHYFAKVNQINLLENDLQKLSDQQLSGKTLEFKDRLNRNETLDDILVEAFAVVRETSRRVLNMRHFDVQLVGGMALHDGKIAEMGTGEGKTLVATLPLYLNALKGEGVHLVTVNDYLAKRDADWMSAIYSFLNMTTGVIKSEQSKDEKKAAYHSDITYGTNNEFGFDYLRDNMVFSAEEKVMRELKFAVIDEVDSILIDEARTPLVISGSVEGNSGLYITINKLVPTLERHEGDLQKDERPKGDYFVDEKNKNVILTEQGHENIEKWLSEQNLIDKSTGLYDVQNIQLIHNVNCAIKAHCLFKKDRDYIIENGEIVIIDEFTGRKLSGRRWSEGLHQAVEAKEKVPIKSESQTLASITFQNYFRLYEKFAGMTGTAETESEEFWETYKLEVAVIPPNKPNARKDYYDLIYLNKKGKLKAIIKDVKECVNAKRPVLVGTASIDMSEEISGLLQKQKIKHSVLNAKNHEKEANIIQMAGMPGNVTIATNMAGRGTDIVLGGNLKAELNQLNSPTPIQVEHLTSKWHERHDQVIKAGGLHVIGSERHESRRIDNQLRGRAGRQGDVGSTRFYLSLEDDLMRIFASDKVKSMMSKLGMADDQPIEHNWVNRSIENAQRKVEGRNYDIRKQLLQYDNVSNDQRQVIYHQRKQLISRGSVKETIAEMREQVINDWVDMHISPKTHEASWQINELENLLKDELGMDIPINKWLAEDHQDEIRNNLKTKIINCLEEDYKNKFAEIDNARIEMLEKSVLLRNIDLLWQEHLVSMDRLRQGIHLRGYAQKNPIQEYKKEAFDLFEMLLHDIRNESIKTLSRLKVQNNEDNEKKTTNPPSPVSKPISSSITSSKPNQANLLTNFQGKKIGRNAPCPCGSGLKYKKCHGAN